MTWRTVIRQSVPAGSSRRLRAVIRDEAGSVLGATELEAITVTLTDKTTGAVVNGRDGQDILNANGGEVTEAGRLTLWLNPADTQILDPARTREVRIAVLEWTYEGGSKTGLHEVVFAVVQAG